MGISYNPILITNFSLPVKPLLLQPLMQDIKEIYSLFNQPKKIVITMHQKPDPDAMGSSLALYHFLKQFGHELQVISPTNWADFLKWMPGCEKVLDFENTKDREKVDAALKSAEWLFCLDFNTLNRTRHMAGMLRSLKCTKILIDHHQQPEVQEFNYGISSTDKSSTCEMVMMSSWNQITRIKLISMLRNVYMPV